MPHGVTFGRPTAPEGLRGLESCTNAEQGTHEELLAQRGAYHRSHELQFRASKAV